VGFIFTRAKQVVAGFYVVSLCRAQQQGRNHDDLGDQKTNEESHGSIPKKIILIKTFSLEHQYTIKYVPFFPIFKVKRGGLWIICRQFNLLSFQ
jgi:hypothetical protein